MTLMLLVEYEGGRSDNDRDDASASLSVASARRSVVRDAELTDAGYY